MSLRVLFLSRHLGPAGTTSHLIALANGLQNAGCTVAVASQQHGKHDSTDSFQKLRIPCYEINFPTPYRSRSENMTRLWKATTELMRASDEFRPDILHVQWRSLTPFAQILKLLRQIPFVTTLNVESIPSTRFYRSLSFWGDRAIAISYETHRELVSKFSVSPNKVQTIHYGCDSEYLRPPSPTEREEARRFFGLNKNDHVVSMLARLSPEKRHEVALKALAHLRSKGLNVHLLAAGASFSRAVTPKILNQLAVDLGIADLVHLLGYTESRRVLWASDATVLPSAYEGLPMAIIEAMLCGVVPIRTPAAGAIDQIDNGMNGFLVPFDDDVALADRIADLLTNSERRRVMQTSALASAREKFSLKNMVEQTLSVYQSVLIN